ncbi:ribonuclease H-like domain-containing protein [Tanacetum coccineum]
MKARGTLLMALPNKDQLKFHSYQDAKLLIEAIKKRYGGNKESKKLEIQGEVINQDDMNLKLLRSLPSEWKFIKHKSKYTECGLLHLYVWITLCDAVICLSLQINPTPPQLYQEDSRNNFILMIWKKWIFIWRCHVLTIRARRFIKRTRKKLNINGQRVGFDKSKVECFNCHKHGHFARECRFPRNQEFKGRENNTRTIAVDTPTQNALIAQDGIGGYDWSYQAEEEQPTNHAFMAFTSSGSSSSSESEVDSYSKTCVKSFASLLPWLKVDPHGFEGYLKMVVEVPDSS